MKVDPGAKPASADMLGLLGSYIRIARGWLRWWFYALLFAAGCWGSLLAPVPLLTNTPPLFANTTGIGSITKALPPHPSNRSAAFALGELRQELLVADVAGNTTAIAHILALAGTWTGRSVSAAELRDMSTVISDLEAHIGVVARVQGLFSFVNVIWCFAILGIAISIGPSVYHILRPIRILFKRAMRWAYEKIILPSVKLLHRWGVFELVAFAGCLLLVLQGFRHDAESGVFVTLTGAVLAAPSFAYSTLLHGMRCSRPLLYQCVYVWLAVCWMPLAIACDSQLMGYITIAALSGSIGFGVWAEPLCIFIGFKTEETLKFATLVSGIVTSVFVALHILMGSPVWLKPFGPAVSILGNVVCLLGMLIMSSRSYSSRSNHWLISNVIMTGALFSTQAIGHLFGLIGMANVGTVFTCIWLLDKYAEWHTHCKLNLWVLLLMLSTAVWQLSLLAHDNPQYIASVFQAF